MITRDSDRSDKASAVDAAMNSSNVSTLTRYRRRVASSTTLRRASHI